VHEDGLPAYVSIRQHTRQQHMSAYISIRQQRGTEVHDDGLQQQLLRSIFVRLN
jgi:hypothetical protein